MDKKLQLKRSNNVFTYTPDVGEPIYDISRNQLRIGNNVIPGGIIPKELYYTSVLTDATITAVENSCVLVDCRTQPITINLPDVTNLLSGTIVKVLDAFYSASETNTITVKSTAPINNISENFIIDLPRAFISFIYIKETNNWLVDLGGIILPSQEILLTKELEWNSENKLGIKEVSTNKLVGTFDLGTF